jgi:hypothetical protein
MSQFTPNTAPAVNTGPKLTMAGVGFGKRAGDAVCLNNDRAGIGKNERPIGRRGDPAKTQKEPAHQNSRTKGIASASFGSNRRRGIWPVPSNLLDVPVEAPPKSVSRPLNLK